MRVFRTPVETMLGYPVPTAAFQWVRSRFRDGCACGGFSCDANLLGRISFFGDYSITPLVATTAKAVRVPPRELL